MYTPCEMPSQSVWTDYYCLLRRADSTKNLNDAWCTGGCPCCSGVVAKAAAEELSGWRLCANIRGKRPLPPCSTSSRPCCRRTSLLPDSALPPANKRSSARTALTSPQEYVVRGSPSAWSQEKPLLKLENDRTTLLLSGVQVGDKRCSLNVDEIQDWTLMGQRGKKTTMTFKNNTTRIELQYKSKNDHWVK